MVVELEIFSYRSPKPLVVEMLEPRDEDDGLAERMIPRNAQLQKYISIIFFQIYTVSLWNFCVFFAAGSFMLLFFRNIKAESDNGYLAELRIFFLLLLFFWFSTDTID